MRKTMSGTIIPPAVFEWYVQHLLDKENAKEMILGIVKQNHSDAEAMTHLNKILAHRPDLLPLVEKYLILI